MNRRRSADHQQPVADTTHAADVAGELTELSYRGLVGTALIGVIGMAGSCALLAHRYHNRVLYAFSLVQALLGMTRATMIFRLERSAVSREALLQSKLRQVTLEAVLLSYYSALGLCTGYNFHIHNADGELLCIIGVFSLCLAVSGRIHADARTAKMHGLLLLLVLGWCLYKPHDHMALAADVLIALFALTFCRAVQTKYDIVVEQIRSRRKLHVLAQRDALTGLMNRRGFEEELQTLCRSGAFFAVLFIDLDRFKTVNDTHGHAVGDALLKAVGRRLHALVRAEDVVARFGGDEFAVLQLPVTERKRAEALAERITKALSLSFAIDDHLLSIGSSIGITLPVPGEADPGALLYRADQALYQAKNEGRGRFVIA